MNSISTECGCGWTKQVSEPEDGQTLYGTLGWYMARHEGDCEQATEESENGVSVPTFEIDHGGTAGGA